MPAAQDRSLIVFISYASEDLQAVSEIVKFLHAQKIEIWFDKENIQPGQDWKLEIKRGIKNADAVIACLSSRSVKKEGFIQKELRLLVDKADEKPEGMIFILPVKLDDCQPPSYLEQYQWLNFFDRKWQEKLLKSLQIRAKGLGVSLSSSGKSPWTSIVPQVSQLQPVIADKPMYSTENPEYSEPPVRRYWPLVPKPPVALVRPPNLPKGLSHDPFPSANAEGDSAFLFHPKHGFFWNGHPLWKKLKAHYESTTIVSGEMGSGRTAFALAHGKYLSDKAVLAGYSNKLPHLKEIQKLFSRIMLDFIAANPFYLPVDDPSQVRLFKQWLATYMSDSLIQARLSQAIKDLEDSGWVEDVSDEKARANYLAEAKKILEKFRRLEAGETQIYDPSESFEILSQCARSLGFSRVRTVFDLGTRLKEADLQNLEDFIDENQSQIEIILFAPLGAAWVNQLESSFVTETISWKQGGVNLLEKMVTHRWEIVSPKATPQAYFTEGAFEHLLDISRANPGRLTTLWNKIMDLNDKKPKISVELVNEARNLVDG